MSEASLVEVIVHMIASPELVFSLMTDPDRHVEWMGTSVRLDPVPGGEYQVRAGDGFAAAGRYLSVDPPRALSFTWGWAFPDTAPAAGGGPDLEAAQLPPGSTRVEVSLDPDGQGTRVRLRHLGLPTTELVRGHQVAWETYLGRLRIRAEGGLPGPDPHQGTRASEDARAHRGG